MTHFVFHIFLFCFVAMAYLGCGKNDTGSAAGVATTTPISDPQNPTNPNASSNTNGSQAFPTNGERWPSDLPNPTSPNTGPETTGASSGIGSLPPPSSSGMGTLAPSPSTSTSTSPNNSPIALPKEITFNRFQVDLGQRQVRVLTHQAIEGLEKFIQCYFIIYDSRNQTALISDRVLPINNRELLFDFYSINGSLSFSPPNYLRCLITEPEISSTCRTVEFPIAQLPHATCR